MKAVNKKSVLRAFAVLAGLFLFANAHGAAGVDDPGCESVREQVKGLTCAQLAEDLKKARRPQNLLERYGSRADCKDKDHNMYGHSFCIPYQQLVNLYGCKSQFVMNDRGKGEDAKYFFGDPPKGAFQRQAWEERKAVAEKKAEWRGERSPAQGGCLHSDDN